MTVSVGLWRLLEVEDGRSVGDEINSRVLRDTINNIRSTQGCPARRNGG